MRQGGTLYNMDADPDRLAHLPLAAADALASQQIEHHREQMAAWRRARAARWLAEHQATGRSARALASHVGVHFTVASELLRLARDCQGRGHGTMI
jgi:hypothetical protein